MDISKILKEQEQNRFVEKLKKDPNLANIRQISEYLIDQRLPSIREELVSIISTKISNLAETVKDGEKGDTGESIIGPQGPIGPKGDTGEKGERGEKGDTGPQGIQGERGSNGLPGERGLQGESGRDGSDGKDGSPDTPTQVVDKLNTLEDVLEPKVIKGFWNIIRTLEKSIREKKGGGGGGAGNWVTEAPSGLINGVNTTFTLSSRVASNGKALILLYQGQVQEPGNQYTLSGTTITMQFAPKSGTFLFALYTRG